MPEPEVPWIISVDDHVMEPPHIWQTYLPDSVPRTRAEGGTAALAVRRWFPAPRDGTRDERARDRLLGHGRHARRSAPCRGVCRVTRLTRSRTSRSLRDMPVSTYDAAARLAAMDEACIERSLCFPNVCRFAGQVFLWMDDKDLARACIRAYNDWMVEEWAGREPWTPASALSRTALGLEPWPRPRVRRNAARGVRAVTFSELPSVLGLPSIHDKDGHWLPFIEACDDTGTVICMHIGSSSTVPVSCS